MTPREWKVRHDVALVSDPYNHGARYGLAGMGTWLNVVQLRPTQSQRTLELLEWMVGEQRHRMLADARTRLAESGRKDHLLNLYCSLNDDWATLSCVWTFSCPGTAVLWRLGLE